MHVNWRAALTSTAAHYRSLYNTLFGRNIYPALESLAILVGRNQVTAKTISERDARILDRYAEGDTLAEIGEREGITRERARQIVAKTRRRRR